MNERIFARGGFEFRIAKDGSGNVLAQFRFKVLFFWWSKWEDWFYAASVDEGIKEVMRVKYVYDNPKKKEYKFTHNKN